MLKETTAFLKAVVPESGELTIMDSGDSKYKYFVTPNQSKCENIVYKHFLIQPCFLEVTWLDN